MTAPADSHILLRALLDEFARCGVELAATSPGSRNTPILQALVRDRRIALHSHIDERCAAFFALGAGKTSGRPALVTCSSGTAAANFAPAVIEAWEAGVPLIVLSADRPPELRQIGAGQTIDQVKLYGPNVKWFFDLGVQDATPERLRWIRSLACRAYITATDGRPGPVHLNVPLREPLVLDGPVPADPPGGEGRPDGAPWVTARRPPVPVSRPRRRELDRMVIVAGELGHDRTLGRRLAGLAAAAGLPLLADPQSGARSGPAAIAHYDLILRDPTVAARLAPRVVCRVGELPTSKPLRHWLATLEGSRQVLFSPDERWSDPSGNVERREVGPLTEALARAEHDELVAPDPAWLEAWRAADATVAAAVAQRLGDGPSEPNVARLLGAELPAEATLFVASSMPIRDVEEFFPVREDPPRVLANRGANGIDGTVSAAFGAAAAGDRPVVLLIGDVALIHDLGGLLAARRSGLPLTVVVINNDGGGIFNFLPIAGQQETFESHVATPHGLDFAHAAALYGCAYERVAELAALRAAVGASLASTGTTIVEIATERTANRELHAELETLAREALSRPGPAAAPEA